MPAHVADEVDADAAGAGVVEVAVEAERPQVALELAAEQWRRLAAACVARFLAAKEDEGEVRAGVGAEGVREGERLFEGEGWSRCFVIGRGERLLLGGAVGGRSCVL